MIGRRLGSKAVPVKWREDAQVGINNGSEDGFVEGISEGSEDGFVDGCWDGSDDGFSDGIIDGSDDGSTLGTEERSSDGLLVVCIAKGMEEGNMHSSYSQGK